MKLKIKQINDPLCILPYWEVSFNGKIEHFNNSHAAFESAKKRFKRYYKESSAYSMVMTISGNLLSKKDAEFIYKLKASKCNGITKSQYGYLKGIHERQEREW